MFCSTCPDFPEKSSDASSFIRRCSNFRIESLRSHVKSTGHIRGEEALRVKANPRNAPLPRALRHSFYYFSKSVCPRKNMEFV
ncbi:hypothetical protein P5673_030626 [Acropora cervicornis]|uniref:Uncharacterized protein n=1 Tax=Acropora cervicornis TaxID=6130 RepID=A0AAD9PTV1_ACRCE|nr:hypothetical protein P5673_030626 [Acropora cervicornis]